MTPQERENRAVEARNLIDNDTLTDALAGLRSEALERLAVTPAEDAIAIREHQAMVRTIDQFKAILGAYILDGTPQKHKPVA